MELSVNVVILIIMMIFLAVGIVDKLVFGSKYGYGTKFEEGMQAMGSLALSMVGIMCFAPVLGALLSSSVGQLFKAFGADPAMIAGSLLANDMGGYNLTKSMTTDVQIQHLSGLFMGSMMGATVVFSIPVSLGIIEAKDRGALAKGMLAGFIAIPFGAFISGLIDGIPVGYMLLNLVFSIVLAILFAVGLALIPDGMMKGFGVFAQFITIVITVFLGVAIVRQLLSTDTADVVFPFLKNMDPIGPQLETCGIIAITLAGAFPLVHFITTVLAKPLASIGKLIGVNDTTIAGMIAALANNIPMFGMMKDMDERGKVLAVAFSVCASFALGDHLGFTAGQAPEAIFPNVVGKILGGVIGVIIAMLLVAPKPAAAAATAGGGRKGKK